MAKNILKILIIFIIGAVGGIFAGQLSPYFFSENSQGPIYITEKKEITEYVQENVALRQAIEKVEKVVVAVKTKTLEGETLKGSGLVATTDGLIVTLADLVPQGSDFAFYVDGKWPAYQILKRDLENNLALIKIEDVSLSTAGFADLEKIKPGERVFLVGMEFSTTTPSRMVNEGIVAFLDEDSIQTNIFEKADVAGSPLFDIEGNVVGLNITDEAGRVSAIPVSLIRQFIGF